VAAGHLHDQPRLVGLREVDDAERVVVGEVHVVRAREHR